ncbi:HAD family phosphatase, partial [candidate division KSB1 bacterium]|nr:HAD family phosphatase [candidate division KSB1 bacterium]
RPDDSAGRGVPTTIFFDVGGVLLDDFIDDKVVDLARKYDRDPEMMLELRKKHRPPADAGKISDQDFWRNLLHAVGIEAQSDDFQVDSYMHPIEAGLDLARKLKKAGYRIAILSNDSREIFQKKRELYQFDHLFDDVIVSNEHGVIKPFMEIYKIALQRMNVIAPLSVFIDDRQENLQAAAELGMYTILHLSAQQTQLQLIRMGIDVR